MTALERVKTRLGIPLSDTNDDGQLQIRLDDAADFFRGYCRRPDIPDRAQSLIERLAVYSWQQRDGIASEKIGDTSMTYRVEDFPLEVQRELNRYRRLAVR